MDPDDILRRQYEQLEMEKREVAVKLRTQEKRIDHLVRAIRQEEIPLLEKHIAEEEVRDREEWEKSEEDRVKFSISFHESYVYLKLVQVVFNIVTYSLP